MAMFKCKMCGGSLEVTEGMTVCECEYCGTSQTLPKSGNEQTLNIINRANHFRQQCEFDKALEIYERLISSADSDAEIYWSLVLCRYGIEYVNDPLTKKKIPTCHRTQFKSILDDADYQQALSLADSQQKELYQSEAKYIDSVQKGILEISNKEEPFDVFICYKESDENGKRTPDSVLAQELYYQLEREGFKVFFSRITLEGKLGTAYEPYIFAALNSSKVMVVVGTKPEFFNAVWVKNEWSRYLMLMQEDKSRTLIPAYRDMDPYDLPDALSMFQAQDMSKLGFMQDLIHGIKKIAKDEPSPQVVQQVVQQTVPASSNIENLLKRGNLALEDGMWDEADNFFEDVLNENAEEPRAYLGKLMAEYQISREDDFPTIQLYANSRNYKKMIRFANDNLRKKFEKYNKMWLYNYAENLLKKGKKNYLQAAEVIYLYFGDEANAERCIDPVEKELNEIKNELLKLKHEQDKLIEQEAQIKSDIDYFKPIEIKVDDSALIEEQNKIAEDVRLKEANVSDISKEISSYEMQIRSLGLFKKREKMQLQSKIDILQLKRQEAVNKLKPFQERLNRNKKNIEELYLIARKKQEEETKKALVPYYEQLEIVKHKRIQVAQKQDELCRRAEALGRKKYKSNNKR